MGTIFSMRNWIVFSLLWAVFAGYLAWTGWPRLPFDSGTDALTRELLRAATRDHILVHLGLAALPPLLMLGLGVVVNRMRGKAE